LAVVVVEKMLVLDLHNLVKQVVQAVVGLMKVPTAQVHLDKVLMVLLVQLQAAFEAVVVAEPQLQAAAAAELLGELVELGQMLIQLGLLQHQQELVVTTLVVVVVRVLLEAQAAQVVVVQDHQAHQVQQ
jgi:hypothetical protein